MKTRECMQLNYKMALRQAEELERMAQQLSSLSTQEGENAVRRIHKAWDADTAADFSRKGQRLTLLMKQRSDALRKIASVLRATAKNTYYAEMKNIEIAERRMR